jgi:hypothetical protein
MTTDPDGEILTGTRVGNLFRDCLAATEADGKLIDGVVSSAAFDQAKVDARRDEIAALLAELPGQFRKSGGGGWSFLNACQDRHGNQWTGEHRSMEQLFMLGMAAGLVTLQLPRALWDALPGGMPYYMVEM